MTSISLLATIVVRISYLCHLKTLIPENEIVALSYIWLLLWVFRHPRISNRENEEK